MPKADARLGIDVGGTNTDAVVMDRDDHLLASAKVATTPDVTRGIGAAIAAVTDQLRGDRARITHAMLGTTHSTNAVLERRDLRRVATIRIGAPATLSVRPLFGWPEDLRRIVSAGETIVEGGFEFDGRPIVALDTDAIARFAASVAGLADAVAVVSVFAPVSEEHELRTKEVVASELGDIHISMSHEVGQLGLLERENATVLNAALTGVARHVAQGFTQALADHSLEPVTFFAQNDGTLMALLYAERFPVLTIGSGPANSLRGAAFLTGLSDAIVVDVGGTSSDIGVLVNGFPRESNAGVEIGGISTNFRMPDLVTIAIGGGTVVGGSEGSVTLGPSSVGYRVRKEALVFGGSTPTLTDASAAAGTVVLGDPSRIGVAFAPLLEEGLTAAHTMLAEAVDRVKTSREDRPLIAVGGGSHLIPDTVPGVSEIHRPDHHDVANAIGAAIAAVSGQVDRVYSLADSSREEALEEARREAASRAVAAGAASERVEIIELDEIPLAYLAHPAVRIRAKAVGALDLGGSLTG
jgi:N-methylhydantoinase A/oxoprolinase/acetone carboxylase beta subunit